MTTTIDERIQEALALFALAEQAEMNGEESKACDLSQNAFNLAEDIGWDWENDTDFEWACLKASGLEVAQRSRKRFLEWAERFHEMQRLNDQLTARGYEPLNEEERLTYLSFSHDVAEERVAMIHDIQCRVLA